MSLRWLRNPFYFSITPGCRAGHMVSYPQDTLKECSLHKSIAKISLSPRPAASRVGEHPRMQ